ncbi:MAG: hypothetical protein HYY16_02990, partial [Planctomycetes bacterium]|nr:hypothetical protein [Planctomycetota bacterium]
MVAKDARCAPLLVAAIVVLGAVFGGDPRPQSASQAPRLTFPSPLANGAPVEHGRAHPKADPSPQPASRIVSRPLRISVPDALDGPMDLADGPVATRCSRRDAAPVHLRFTTPRELDALLDQWTLSAEARSSVNSRAKDAWDMRVARQSADKTTLCLRGMEWVEEFDLIAHPAAFVPERAFQYTLQLGADVACLTLAPEGTLEVRGPENDAWLRMPRPTLIDAQGVRHEGEILVDGVGARHPDVVRIEAPPERTVDVTIAFKPLGPDAFPVLIDPAWTNTTSMATAREMHTGTVLEDMRVLIAGGWDASSNPLSSCEIYNPVTATWTGTGALPVARRHSVATLLADGRVLLTGGNNSTTSTVYNTAYLWNSSSNSWSATANTMNSVRALHRAIRLTDGRVLVMGGATTQPDIHVQVATPTCDLFDPSTNSFSAAAAMAVARCYFGVAPLGGNVLVAGGGDKESSGTTEVTSNCAIYTPNAGAGSWANTASLAGARYRVVLAPLPDGTILRASGNDGAGALTDCDLYSGGTWNPTGALPDILDSWTCTDSIVTTPPGVVLQAGGNNMGPQPTTYRYASGTWTTVTSMNTAREWAFGVRIEEGKMLVCGGRTPTVTASAEIYENVAGGNTAPSTPSSLQQRKIDDVTVIPDDGSTPETQIRFAATVSDPNSDTVRLQVELKPTSSSFDGTGLVTSTAVASGSTASVLSATLSDATTYRWRARTLDAKDAASAWVEYEEGAFEITDASTALNAPSVPSITRLFDNERLGDTTPTLAFSSTDAQMDTLHYEVQWDTLPTFPAPQTRASDTDPAWFSGSPPYASGTGVLVTFQTALTDLQTYWWRARARDIGGSNTWSPYSTPRSFTVDTSVSQSEWFQTTRQQFDTDWLSGTRTTAAGEVELVPITDDFEDNNLSEYASSGNAAWSTQSATVYTGTYAAKAGTIGNNQTTGMVRTVTHAAGTLTFYWKVDSSSAAGGDYLRFLIDSVEQAGSITGNVNWTLNSVAVAAGTHTYVWRYTKNAAAEAGADTGWVDDITWPPSSTPGEILSSPIRFADFPNSPSGWNQVTWSDDQSVGDLIMQVMYDDDDGNEGTDPVVVPDAALAGNSTGFDTATGTGTIDISGLSTVTYAKLYLRATLTYIGGSPKLLDWTLTASPPGVSVSAISGPTSENAGTATFTVVLTSAPTADVLIPLSSSNPAEGTLSTATLTFTAGNWSTPQTITVTGVN